MFHKFSCNSSVIACGRHRKQDVNDKNQLGYERNTSKMLKRRYNEAFVEFRFVLSIETSGRSYPFDYQRGAEDRVRFNNYAFILLNKL